MHTSQEGERFVPGPRKLHQSWEETPNLSLCSQPTAIPDPEQAQAHDCSVAELGVTVRREAACHCPPEKDRDRASTPLSLPASAGPRPAASYLTSLGPLLT